MPWFIAWSNMERWNGKNIREETMTTHKKFMASLPKNRRAAIQSRAAEILAVDPPVVVTVYRTNKIAKYWRKP
jgi:hypothetical protein